MASLGKAWQALRVLHTALMASVVMYAVVVFAMTQQPGGGKSTAADPMLMLGILGGTAAVVLFVVLPIVRSKLMPPLDRVGDGRGVDLREPVTPEIDALLAKLRSASIVTWALCESVAVCGVVAAILLWKPLYYAPFGAVALLAMLYFAPRVSLLEQALRPIRR